MELVWDQVGERRYETGIDRGVLFLPNNAGAVPWTGLVSVTENQAREVKSYYIDGVKYLDHQVMGAYSAELRAFTYPDELDELTGTAPFSPGVFIHDQRSRPFSLSYRTKVGNDLDGLEHGYKLHILYNVLAAPGNLVYDSVSNALEPQPFSWTLNGTPEQVLGIRPTSHISLHTRSIDPDLLVELEELLYGTSETSPTLPSLVELLGMVEEFYS